MYSIAFFECMLVNDESAKINSRGLNNESAGAAFDESASKIFVAEVMLMNEVFVTWTTDCVWNNGDELDVILEIKESDMVTLPFSSVLLMML